MKASFCQRDVPVFLSLASRYAPVSVIEPARKALKVFAFGYNQNLIYDETVDLHIPAISILLNNIAQKLKIEANCTFFEEHSIEFGLLASYEHALEVLTVFKSSDNKPYGIQVNKFLAYDLLHIVNIIAGCKKFQKSRSPKIDSQKEFKKPVIKDVDFYTSLFFEKNQFPLAQQKQTDPVNNAHALLIKCLELDSIHEKEFNQLHGYLETILMNGWSHYYKIIKFAYSNTKLNTHYASILKKLEIVGQNIINVNLIGRHSRQVSAIDIENSTDNESHRKMMAELQGFLGNMFCFFLAYNYLSQRIQKSTAHPELENEVIYTWTCGFCNKKFGSTKAVVIDHSTTIIDADGIHQRVVCPGKKHPPLETGDSGLRIKAETEKSRYENAVIELNALNTTTSLMVIGKHSNRVFTPKDLSWADRLNKAKAEKNATVNELKAVHEASVKALNEWQPIPVGQVPVWTGTGTKKKAA